MPQLRLVACTLLLLSAGCCGIGERPVWNLQESLARQLPVGTPVSAVVSTLQQNQITVNVNPLENPITGWTTEYAGTCFFTYRVFGIEVGIDHDGKVCSVVVRAYLRHLWI